MNTVAFRSEQFRPYLPDDCQVNPNVLGFELAHWLSVELMKAGVITSYPNSEDWGWFLSYSANKQKYMICCGGYEDEETNSNRELKTFHEWKVFVQRPKGFFGRLTQTDDDNSQGLIAAIIKCLENAEISVEVEED